MKHFFKKSDPDKVHYCLKFPICFFVCFYSHFMAKIRAKSKKIIRTKSVLFSFFNRNSSLKIGVAIQKIDFRSKNVTSGVDRKSHMDLSMVPSVPYNFCLKLFSK